MDGVLVIDKPKGVTSHDVVYMVRRKLGIKKVGHTGTLDPIATGVLPVLIGKATKLSDRLTASSKEYIAEFKFGIQTDSLDITGNVTHTSTMIPSEDSLKKELVNFTGDILQEPPIYSAIKIKGKKLYEYARAGEKIEIPKR
ncbi:MAG: tRNA pseudouridine(55) synthase TruB, partial [Peptoniphilus sp.]|uniref:tRNA pseudouridine(55) synthase TruB n=1 Tax=Peptoniphilus sp. TaxID=1971214 RepID=UPI002A75AF8A